MGGPSGDRPSRRCFLGTTATMLRTELPMRRNSVIALLAALWIPTLGRAQEYKAEVLSEAPPASLAAPVKDVLAGQGIRILDDQGKPYVDLWLRKAIPATDKPAGPKGPILFPFLQEGD